MNFIEIEQTLQLRQQQLQQPRRQLYMKPPPHQNYNQLQLQQDQIKFLKQWHYNYHNSHLVTEKTSPIDKPTTKINKHRKKISEKIRRDRIRSYFKEIREIIPGRLDDRFIIETLCHARRFHYVFFPKVKIATK